jgi:hypothetical protein
MAHDPRAAEAARKYMQVLNEINALGMPGFAKLLDTADKDEMDDLLVASDVVLEAIARVKRDLAFNPAKG